MTFDERMARVKAWMKSDVLARFSPPRGVDPAIAAKDVAEAVNRSIAGHLGPDAFDAMLTKILAEVVKQARGRTLPTVRDFTEAARACADSKPATPGTGRIVNLYALTERKIRAGEPVSDRWLKEPGRSELLANTSLTDTDLAPYIAQVQRIEEGIEDDF